MDKSRPRVKDTHIINRFSEIRVGRASLPGTHQKSLRWPTCGMHHEPRPTRGCNFDHAAMQIAVSRVILYVKDVANIAAFYQRHFSMTPLPDATDGWIELSSGEGGCNIALHKAASSQKSGAAIKIVFGVADVDAFKNAREAEGLAFGPVHRHGDFAFANSKDPAGNSIQVSSRGVRKL